MNAAAAAVKLSQSNPIATTAFALPVQTPPPQLQVTPVSATRPQTTALMSEKGRWIKRSRTAFETHQVLELERLFRQSQYPTPEQREHLSSHINLSEARVQVNIVCGA